MKLWDRSERHHCPSVQKCVLLRGTVSAQHGVRQCVSQRGAVFLSVEQCFSVWSSVWSTFPGSPGKIGCRARPVPPPLRYSAPLFLSYQLFCSPRFGYFGTHFIKLLPRLLLKCTQVKYGSFGTRVLMGSVDVEGIWDDGDLRPSLTGAHSGHQGPVRSLLNSAAHQSARIAVCSKQKSEMLCSNQCLCWWDLIKIKPKNCKKAFCAARARSREQLGSETLEFSVWKKLHHRIENYFWHIWQ